MKKVFVGPGSNPAEAYRIRDLLRDHGIAAEVTNEVLMGAFGELPMDISTLPTVWIPEEWRADEADAIIKKHLKPPEGAPWRCACGEENGHAFTDCPMCGAPRPDGESA